MKADTYLATGAKASSQTTLDKAIFEVEPKSTQLIAQVYEVNRRNERTVNAYTKTRGEVRGGGRKPWKQKGTGRARAGTIRSPIWRGGGITFGPTGELAAKKASKKSRRTALKQALTLAAKDDDIMIVKSLPTSGKTKDAAALLSKIGIERKAVVVAESENAKLAQATRNIPGITYTTAARLTVNEVLDNTKVVFEEKALAALAARLGGKDE